MNTDAHSTASRDSPGRPVTAKATTKRGIEEERTISSPICAILLAGGLRPSELVSALDGPVLSLPIGPAGSVLDAWARALGSINAQRDVRIVVKDNDHVDSIGTCIRACDEADGVRTLIEPAAWRGVGGILRDMTNDLDEDAIVMVGEGSTLPPESLDMMIAALAGDVAGVVGVRAACRPAGIYAFRRSALEAIPTIGYFDLKEQFLPSLAERGGRVVTTPIGGSHIRLRNREGYLRAVGESLTTPTWRVCGTASVSPTATLDGFGIIEAGAIVEDGAVVHDSVLLEGATIGGGAIVSRSVVGPLVRVPSRGTVVADLQFTRDFGPTASGRRSAGRKEMAGQS